MSSERSNNWRLQDTGSSKALAPFSTAISAKVRVYFAVLPALKEAA